MKYRGYILFEDGNERLTKIVASKQTALKNAAEEIDKHPDWKVSVVEYGYEKQPTDSGTVSPMLMGAFWIVPAVWLLLHFAVHMAISGLGR